MSYYGSFSNSAFSGNQPYDSRSAAAASEPYGSARYAMTDSTWALNQTANIWSTQPQQQLQQFHQQVRYEQPRYDPPRYQQVFDQQPIVSRPLNPMAGVSTQPMYPLSSYSSGGGSSGNFFNTGRNDRYDDRRDRGGERRDNRQWIPKDDRPSGGYGGGGYRNDNRNGGGRNSYSNSRNGGGDSRRQGGDRRRNDDRAPRRVSEGASPKQVKQKKDYGPSRIAPASSSPVKKEQRDGQRGAGRETGPRKNNQNGRGPMKRRNNKSTDLEFTSIPDSVASKSFVVKSENLVCFQGLNSVLTMQHEFPIVIDDDVYTSVDHYYQIEKCKQLAGKDCKELMASVQAEDEYRTKKEKKSSSNYGQLAREFLKENKVDRAKVEEWRREGGVFATYTAMKAKAQQCPDMRDFLHNSVDKIIVHTYAGDAIFGSGTRVQFVHKWADELGKAGSKIEISLAPLVDTEAISMAPQIAQGRNILGLIHMQLAEEIAKGNLPLVITSASLEAGSGSSVDDIDISAVEISQEQEDELMKED